MRWSRIAKLSVAGILLALTAAVAPFAIDRAATELRRRAENSQAQWRAAVAACQAGDYSQCSGATPR